MSLFKLFLDYLIYLNIVISISAFVVTAGVAKVFGLGNIWEYGLFSFFSTFCAYNAQRLVYLKKGSHVPRLKWMYARKKMVIISTFISALLSFRFLMAIADGFNLGVILVMGIALSISILYVIPIGKKCLRDVSFVKTHAIALTWTLIILGVPAVNQQIWGVKFLLCFIPAHYLYFLAVAASFDIQDLKIDPQTQQTIPQIKGLRHTKKVAIILLIISSLGITYCFFNPLTVFALLIQILLIAGITEKRTSVYFNVFVDGAVLVLGVSYLFQ